MALCISEIQCQRYFFKLIRLYKPCQDHNGSKHWICLVDTGIGGHCRKGQREDSFCPTGGPF